MQMERPEAYRYEPFVAVILGTENPENLASLTDKHPGLLLSLGARPVLSYQLAFLARNHIHRTISLPHICRRDRSHPRSLQG